MVNVDPVWNLRSSQWPNKINNTIAVPTFHTNDVLLSITAQMGQAKNQKTQTDH